MRWSLLVVLVVAHLAIGCASPTDTIPPPPTLPPTVAEPGPTATDEPFRSYFRGTGPPITADARAPSTETPEATVTPETTAEPTEEPTPEATDEPVPQAKPLEVEFVDLHYECQKRCTQRSYDRVHWSYRSFQALMRVRNVSSDLTLTGGEDQYEGWAPTTWFISGGIGERTDGYAWQWVAAPGGVTTSPRVRPDIPPGGEGEWTWIAFPLNYGEWVSAVEYEDEWGNLYRQQFPTPEGGQFNYVDCGDPKEGSC